MSKLPNKDNNGIMTGTATITSESTMRREDDSVVHFGQGALMSPVEEGDKVQYRMGKLGESNVVLCISKL